MLWGLWDDESPSTVFVIRSCNSYNYKDLRKYRSFNATVT